MTTDERRDLLIRISNLVANAQQILITSHINPDGDALGACLALAAGLRQIGKQPVVWLEDGVPANLRFLPGSDAVLAPPARPSAADLVFVLDMSEASRASSGDPEWVFGGAPIVNVDHHQSNRCFGTVNLVDPSAAATCELLFSVLQAIGIEVSAPVATPLLAGIITDTLGFRTSNTSSSTLRLAAELVDRGAPLTELDEALHKTHTLPQLKLWGLALAAMQSRAGGRLIWTSVDQAMINAAGATIDLAEGVVNILTTARDADAIVVFKRFPEGRTRASVRTSGLVNAAAACETFGGGGHVRAAGCSLPDPSPAGEQALIDCIERLLVAAPAANVEVPAPTVATVGTDETAAPVAAGDSIAQAGG